MTDERQIRRADLIFGVLLAALAALWIAYPPGRAQEPVAAVILGEATR